MKKVKTCVYAIALNEIKFVDRFMDHCEGADLVLVCDTGSTDRTPERLRERGAVVYDIVQKPWRFDVPRNTALHLIPKDIDICLSIDLDEFLQPGWVDVLDKAWQDSNGTITRIAYDYIWNWKSDGSPDIRFYADKIHHRHNYIWRHPCHETLYYDGSDTERRVTLPDLQLQHHADITKSRGQYLHLLKMAVEEDQENDRMAHYYARELFFRGQYQEAIDEFNRHLSLPNARWLEERASSYRYMSRCYRNLGKFKESQDIALKGVQEYDQTREPWLELARAAYSTKDWHTCFYAATKCLSITTRSFTYMGDSTSWGVEPHDLAALAAYNLGYYKEALDQGRKALGFDVLDQRLQTNLDFYLKKYNEEILRENKENRQ